LVAAAVIVFGVIAIVVFGIASREYAEAQLAQSTDVASVPVVDVTTPKAGTAPEELVLPGSTIAFTDTPIHARVSGYLKSWHFDIGARVKKGTLLAEIDAPELDAQLRQAQADLSTARANLALAAITAKRNETLLSSKSVSVQDRDNSAGLANADAAIVQSRTATVAQLTQTQSYERIYAPFDGVVTARNTDIGALIDAGAGTSAELFHMTATDVLRIYVSVPEMYSRSITTRTLAKITLDEYPGQEFKGQVVRTSNAIDLASRTLLVEVDVQNPNGQLLPGAYAFVHFKFAPQGRAVTIPSNALLFRQEGPQVGVVRNGNAVLVGIKVGRDYGDRLEVLSGLTATDAVILDPSDSLTSGSPVHSERVSQ